MVEGLISQVPTPKDEGFWARLNHPIFGAFAASWIIWNWEIAYLLIRGLPSASETVKEINERYLVAERLSHLLWIPLAVAIAFLLLGPVLKDVYSLYKNKISALIGRYETVAKWEYDRAESDKRNEREEKEIYQRALQSKPRMVNDGKGNVVPVENLIQDSVRTAKYNQELQQLNSQLNAEILLLREKTAM